MSRGRPTKYDPNFHPIWAEKLAKLGATNEEIAATFEISVSTIWEWSQQHPIFSSAIKSGKDFADAEVASKLFARATGYEHPEDDIKVVNGEIVITPTVKRYPPDTAAAFIWLKNRQPKRWRDRQPEEQDDEGAAPTKIVVEVKDARKPDPDPDAQP